MGVPLELLEPNKAKQLCAILGVNPKKSLSQNFLCSNSIVQRIVSLVKDESRVVEIGPGSGALTYYLSQNKQLTAIEKDDFWSEFISKNYPNVNLIHQDILDVDSMIYAGQTVVGNLPYNISTAIIRTLLSSPNPPARLIVMLQKEVAMRIVSPKASKLSLGIAYYGTAKLKFLVHKRYFYPQPKVDSAIVEIISHHKYPRNDEQKDLFNLIKIAFNAPRKKLGNNLKPILGDNSWSAICLDLGLDDNVRPEDVNLDQWLALSARLKR